MAGTVLMRIIAGSARGRRLVAPKDGTRPLTGRAKEALFSILGEGVVGARVLDLYAGSGSLGLEALSRGATSVVFVERDRRAVDVLERNIAAVGLGGRVEASDVAQVLARIGELFDVVFVDPPYDLDDAVIDDVLAGLAGRVAEGGTVVVHRRSGGTQPDSDNLRLTDRRRYGDTELWLYTKEGA
jgi:16S rRNA (guanine966-N2)-methyltransferase